VSSIIQQLAQSGAPDKAIPMIDSLLVQNPGDPAMLSTKWKLQRAAKQYKAALATGEELVKIDTAAATLDYYQIQIGVAQADSNAAMVSTLAAKAAQKFPKDAQLQMILVTGYRKAGQLQQAYDAARRVNALDPKRSDAWLYAVATAKDLNMPDSALAIAQKAVAAGSDKDAIGQQLLLIVDAARQKAISAKGTPEERADWEQTLKTAQAVDAVIPTVGTKFFIGYASFQVALDAINHANALQKTAVKDKADRAKACEETKIAEDMAATTAIAMPAGGAYSKEAAGQILAALSQVQDAIPQYKKLFCTGK
jgi:tetratricopeptide (TPR) repeat protein